MSFFKDKYAQLYRSAKQYRASKLGPFSPSDESAIIRILNGGSASTVDANTAMTISAFWNGIDQISNAVSMLPLVTFERISIPELPNRSSKKRATGFRLFKTLALKPNRWQSSGVWRKMMQVHVFLRGNAYSFIHTNVNGTIELIPLPPDRVTPFYILRDETVRSKDGSTTIKLPAEKAYEYQPPTGGKVVFLKSEVLHIMSLSTDGLQGVDPISAARKSYELTIGAEEEGNSFYSNDATPNLVLEYPGKLGDDEYKNLSESWAARYKGAAKSNSPAILEEGLTVKTIGLSPENSQFLQTRKFQIAEVARWLNIQPHKIKDLERATNNNIEQQSLEYLTDTVMPWLRNWEQTLLLTLFSDSEQDRYFPEFITNALLRGDTAARSQFYKDGRQNGWFSANDIRDLENLTPIGEQGEVYMVPQNYQNQEALLTVGEDDGQENQN